MKVRAKYAMTAFTSFVAEKDEVLTKEDFVSRLVALGLDEKDAEKSFNDHMKRGSFEKVEEADAGPEEAPAEPEAAKEEAPADDKPKRGRPKKQG